MISARPLSPLMPRCPVWCFARCRAARARIERYEKHECMGVIIPMLYTSADEPGGRKYLSRNHPRLGLACGRADAACRLVLRPRHRHGVRRGVLDDFAFAGSCARF